MHSCSLIIIFTERVWIAKDAKYLQADNEDSNQTAQLSLRWVHMPEGTFSQVVTHVFFV